ncbi:MFS general substrate transporter [Backusella circina FSU 941]|nr:MFS general substrate transporter [Backusella circina FSU 941]
MYLVCKLLYVAVFALLSAAPPYLPLYYHDVLGFSSDQIGFVLAIAPFIQSISCPLWSVLVDKFPRWHGTVMAITSFIGGASVMGIMVMGHIISVESIPKKFIPELSNSMLVAITSALALAFAFFSLPNMSLVDSAVMKILGPNKILYGEQRLWGSVSAGLTILIVGQLVSITGNLDALFWVFGGSTVVFITLCLFTNISSTDPSYMMISEIGGEPNRNNRLVPIMTGNSEKYLNNNRINNYSSITQDLPDLTKLNSIASHTVREEADETLDTIGLDLGLSISRIASIDHSIASIIEHHEELPPVNVFKSLRVVTFLSTTLFFGFVLSIIVNFLFLFLSRDLLMPASWIGWTGPTSGITELMCFCFSKQLTEKFGVTNMIVAAHVATILRCLAYTILAPDSLLTNISALLLQTLHGIGFGIFWATSVSEVDSFFPPEQRSIAQGLLGALHAGLGQGIGAFCGGYLYEYLGAIWMFRVAAAVAALNMGVFCLGRLERFN